ncbi:MAG: hypothetical protein ACR2RL_03070, partial [Gammaproteobacteria bacterium]
MADFNRHDLEFILEQIKIAEAHARGDASLPELTINPNLSLGLRTIDGSQNNLIPDQAGFGAADRVFPRLLTPEFRGAENLLFDPDGPGPQSAGDPTSYDQTSGFVQDSEPRVISNLIVDQKIAEPGPDGVTGDDPNTPADESAD